MRYLRNVFYAFLLWLAATFIMSIPSFAIGGVIYPSLKEWFPTVFKDINPIIDPEGYERLNSILDLLSATATVFIISYFTVRFDNERMEYMIRRTEGMYLVKEGCAIYYPRYTLQDLFVALVLPLPLILVSFYLPDQLPDFLTVPLRFVFGFTHSFTDLFGYFLGYIYSASSVFVSRLLFGLSSLSSWRGVWLSDI